MSLTKSSLKQLIERAHTLKPVIIIGQKGFTPEVQEEMDSALTHHELIKIRIGAPDKTARQAITQAICDNLHCTLIHTIGHVIVVYRAK